MSAQTPIYGIKYPTADDLVRGIPDQLQEAAQTTEAALNLVDRRATPEGSVPVTATTASALTQLQGIPGQSAIVTNDVPPRNGMYFHDGSGWTRGAVSLDATSFEFFENENWSSQWRAWLAAGTLFVAIRLVRKTDYPGNGHEILYTDAVGFIKEEGLRPPWYYHLPAFATETTLNDCGSFGIQISAAGDIKIESLKMNAGLKKNAIIESTMTWPTTAFN